jgi:hypothetical protein
MIYGTFTFRWCWDNLHGEKATVVYVEYFVDLGDAAAQVVTLVQEEDNVFRKAVDFQFSSVLDSLYYRYNVDGEWTTDPDVYVDYTADPSLSGVHILRPNQLTKKSDLTPKTLNQVTTINSTPNSSYTYRKLDFDTYEIRILRLDWTDEEDCPLVCSLEHASLIDPGSYFALSYCVSVLNSFFPCTLYVHFCPDLSLDPIYF